MAFELLYIAIEFQVNTALQIQYKRQIAIAEQSHFSLPIFFSFAFLREDCTRGNSIKCRQEP